MDEILLVDDEERHFIQDPQDKWTYGFDYAGILPAGVTIVEHEWTSDAGITATALAFAGTKSTVRVEGPLAPSGSAYVVRNKVTLSNGDVKKKSLLITFIPD